MEFLDFGDISADVISESDPNGVITHTKTSEKEMIEWTTEVYEENPDWMQRWGGAKLYSDQEITNKIDRDFFIKIFTDKVFRDKIIAEYEEEWGGSEITAENLRSMLYYKKGEKIFPESSGKVVNTEEIPGTDSGTGAQYYGTII